MITKTNDPVELREQLDSLRAQHEIAQLQREIAMLQTSSRTQEIAEAALINSVHAGYLYDSPNEAPIVHRSTFGDYLPDVPGNRDRGQDAVVFTTDAELAEIRGVGRTLAWLDETSAGILRSLVRYVVGTGFDCEIKGKVDRKEQLKKIKAERQRKAAEKLQAQPFPPASPPSAPTDTGDEEPTKTAPAVPSPPMPDEPIADPAQERRDAIAERCNKILDEVVKRTRFRRKLTAELVKRLHRDGEYFVRVVATKLGTARIQIIEPSEISTPANPQSIDAEVGEVLDWSFGIGTQPGDPSDVVAYYRHWGTSNGTGEQWEVIPAIEMVHVKANVDDNVKRGVSDFFICYRNIERTAKITRNSGSGAAIQAAIAFIREWTNPTSPGEVSGRIGSSAGIGGAGNPAAQSRTVRTQNFEEGTVVDTYGAKYHSGPLGQQTLPAVMQIAEAIKRHYGILWGMPGWMLTGDASGTTSYASAFVAESPFVRACEGEQEEVVDTTDIIVTRVMDIATRAGQFAEWGISKIEQLLAEVDIHTERPSVSVRNRAEESDIYAALYEKKGVSLRTWVTKMGLDWEQEQVFLEDEPEPEPPPMLLPFGGGQSGGPQPPQGEAPRPGMPIAESEDIQEAKDATPEPAPAPPADELPPSDPEPEPTPTEDEQEDESEDDESDPEVTPKRKAGETVREWQERVAATNEDVIEITEDETPPDTLESLDLTDEATRFRLAAKLLWSDY